MTLLIVAVGVVEALDDFLGVDPGGQQAEHLEARTASRRESTWSPWVTQPGGAGVDAGQQQFGGQAGWAGSLLGHRGGDDGRPSWS
jgi:hypothetical protein